MRSYYKHRLFMGYCCISCEVLYLMLYLLHWAQFWRFLRLNLGLPLERLPLAKSACGIILTFVDAAANAQQQPTCCRG